MNRYENIFSRIKTGEEYITLEADKETDIDKMEDFYGGMILALSSSKLTEESQRKVREYCVAKIKEANKKKLERDINDIIAQKAKEQEIEKRQLDIDVAKLTRSQLKQRNITLAIGGAIGLLSSIVGGMILMLAGQCTPKKAETIQVQIVGYPTNSDTTYNEKRSYNKSTFLKTDSSSLQKDTLKRDK